MPQFRFLLGNSEPSDKCRLERLTSNYQPNIYDAIKRRMQQAFSNQTGETSSNFAWNNKSSKFDGSATYNGGYIGKTDT